MRFFVYGYIYGRYRKDAAILEEWGFEVGGAYLIHIGPGDEEAKLIKVKDMRKYIRKYFTD